MCTIEWDSGFAKLEFYAKATCNSMCNETTLSVTLIIIHVLLIGIVCLVVLASTHQVTKHKTPV